MQVDSERIQASVSSERLFIYRTAMLFLFAPIRNALILMEKIVL
jgi:hypothetical protein